MKRLENVFLPIFYLLLSSFLSDQIAKWAANEFANNMPVLHSYSFLQAIFLFWFFIASIRTNKLVLKGIAICYLLYHLVDSIWIEGLLAFNQNTITIQNILFIGICIYYFYNYYQKEATKTPEKDGSFWIVVGVLTYYSGSLFTHLLSSKILTTSNETFFGTWILHNFSNFLKNLIILLGLWIGRIK